MIAVRLTRVFHVEGAGDLDAHTDLVMDELLSLESDAVRDADVAASLSENRVEISVYAVGEDFDAAASVADSAIRSAIHAAGGHTPNWVALKTTADRADLVSA